MREAKVHRRGNRSLAALGASLLLIALGVPAIRAAEPPAPPKVSWDSLGFLMGDWIGEGGGGPGQGEGSFSFTPDLQGRILVRKNQAKYPATAERPAFTHDDLMVVYQEAPPAMRADYFDNEGHVIRYTVEVSKDGNSAVFLSEPSSSGPRFRLTYAKTGADTVSIKFEIAVPGKPEFTPYLQAAARRKK